jgi:hypothetical protein
MLREESGFALSFARKHFVSKTPFREENHDIITQGISCHNRYRRGWFLAG